MHKDMEERAVVIGVAQTFGQAFIAWVPVLILDVGKYAPRFKMGFAVMSGISVLQFAAIFLVRWFGKWEANKERDEQDEGASDVVAVKDTSSA